jgi:Acetyltransferase (GNAT) domain
MGAAAGDLIDLLDPLWATILSKVPHDIYHTPVYVGSEASRIGAVAKGFVVVERGRSFFLPLLLRGPTGGANDDEDTTDAVSPYGYPGLLLSEPGPPEDGFVDDCVERLLTTLRANRVCSAFVRMHPLLNADLPDHLRRHPLTATGTTASVDLMQSEQRLWATMSRGHANAVNKARRAGYQIHIGPLRERLDDFYAAYEDSLARLGACPPEHNREHLQRLAGMAETQVVVATLEDRVAGAYMLFEHQGIVQMHLGGPRTAFMRPSPSHLLIHAVCLWAKRRGNRVVHLGGGVGGSTSDSLFTFKAGFSHRRHAFYTLRLVADPVQYGEAVRRRAAALGIDESRLAATRFFPAHRATLDQT